MKKMLYILLLLLEAVAGFLSVRVLRDYLGMEPCVILLTIWALLLARQIILLAKEEDAERKGKIRKRILLVMLIPISGCIIGPLVGVLSFVIAYSF